MGYSLLSINHNLPALNLHRSIQQSSWQLGKSMEKLASGLAINHASDDPAGLVISEQMRSRIASLNQEIENVSNQINKYNTADSSLMQMRSQLTEMRSLAVAAANDGAVDEGMRQAYQSEMDNLVGSYNRIRETASYGKQELLDGSEGSVTNVAEIPAVDLSSSEAAGESLERIDEEIERMDSTLSNVGAYQKHGLQRTLSNLRVEHQNLTAAESTIRDLDYAAEFTNLLKNQIMFSAGVSLMAHTGMASKSLLTLFE